MDKLKKELEILRSWGIESIPVDKVLSMIDEVEEEGVDKYFREIPMYVTSDRTFNRGDLLSSSREVWYT